MGGTTPAIDYDALAKQHGAVSSQIDYDALAAQHGATSSVPTEDFHAQLKKKYGLPEDVDLTKTIQGQPSSVKHLDIMNFSRAYSEANPALPEPKGFLDNLWGEAKNIFKGTVESEGTGGMSGVGVDWAQRVADNPVNAIPIVGPMIAARAKQAKTDVPGAIGAGLTDALAMGAPLLLDKAMDFSPMAKVQEAMGRRLSSLEADAPRPGGQIQPALNNTPREVLMHAKQEGINLTPGQATEDAMAQHMQKAGATAAIGGKDLSAALKENQVRFGQAVNNFMEDVDPKRMGLSAESAGEHIQQTAKVALGVRHENATASYAQAAVDQANLAGDVSVLKNFADSKLNVRQPGAAVARPEYQSPSVKSALDDIADAPDRLGKNPSIQSMRNLRTEFWEKGNDYSGNIPDSARALYKQAASMVDDQMMRAAKGTPFEQSFRDASAQWKDLQQKFNEPGTPLYKILQQKDPTKIVSMLQSAPATDIIALKAEGMDAALEPLRRQVIQDIARNRFNVGREGLGGYSDAYLKSLFSPEQVKELYLKGDLAGRLKYDPNPSGTGSNITSIEQLKLGNQTKMSAAAKMSMPRDPLSFLSDGAPTQLPGRLSTASLAGWFAQKPDNQGNTAP